MKTYTPTITKIFEKYKIFLLLFIHAIVAILTIYFFDGTGDSGDSVMHYQLAKYAPKYPKFFLDHWAKPVYVLLASPFAQFGFVGIKVFNTVVTLITIFFTFKIIQKLNIKNEIIGALILIFSPLCFVLTFSGLTEPLFAMFLCMGIYSLLADKFIVASLVVSFLPFVRSEGLIILGVFGLYFLLKRKWKLIPLLMFGHVVYSLAGFFIYEDLLWVFNKIPYAHLSSVYGSGNLFDFAKGLIFVVGVPIYILFWIGAVAIIWKSIKKRITIELQVLVFLGFFSFFIAHSLFWYLGIFNSMGLIRVLIGVAPLISIVALIGFNFITDEALKNKRTLKLFVQGLLTAYILIFPFTSNPAAIHWEKELNLTKDQQAANEVADFIAKNTEPNQRYIFAHPYLSEALNIDPFDDSRHKELTKDAVNEIKSGDIIIWENYSAVVERGITKEDLDNNDELDNLYDLSFQDNGRERLYSVYKKK